jgi:hypothetical protein
MFGNCVKECLSLSLDWIMGWPTTHLYNQGAFELFSSLFFKLVRHINRIYYRLICSHSANQSLLIISIALGLYKIVNTYMFYILRHKLFYHFLCSSFGLSTGFSSCSFTSFFSASFGADFPATGLIVPLTSASEYFVSALLTSTILSSV